LLLLVHDAYGNLMADTSSFFYGLLNDDPFAAIIRDGDVMVYSAGTMGDLGGLGARARH
jgi:hypothetical protein